MVKIPPFIAAVPAQQQAAALKSAVDSGKVAPADAKLIANALRFPAWERFAHATVGTFSYGTTELVVSKWKPLPATSPLFAMHTKMIIIEEAPRGLRNRAADYFPGSPSSDGSSWRDQDIAIVEKAPTKKEG